MPRTADASSVTQFKRVSANVISGPSAKSRTFTPTSQIGVLSATVRTSVEGQGRLLGIPTWKNPQRATTRFLTGPGAPSCVAETRIYRNVSGFVSVSDPTEGGFGFFVDTLDNNATYLIISTIDGNDSDATMFINKLFTATSIQLSNTTRPTEITAIPISSTNYGTYSAILVTPIAASGVNPQASDIFEITANC